MGCANSQAVINAEVYILDTARDFLNTFQERTDPLGSEVLVIDIGKVCDDEGDELEIRTRLNDITRITSDDKKQQLLRIKEMFIAKEKNYDYNNKVVLENGALMKHILRGLAKVETPRK